MREEDSSHDILNQKPRVLYIGEGDSSHDLLNQKSRVLYIGEGDSSHDILNQKPRVLYMREGDSSLRLGMRNLIIIGNLDFKMHNFIKE